jgi:hypothetical protein
MRTAFIYSIFKRWLFVLAVVFILVMNYLSTAIPFGGMTNAEVSEKYSTFITPAGYAFAIWGFIYLSIITFAFFQLRKGKEIRFYNIIWPYFMVNALANGLWLLAFQNEWLGLSVGLIFILLGSLIAMFRVFYRLKSALSTTHRFFFHVPFGMYLGWVSIASILNVAVWLTSLKLEFFAGAESFWSLVMLCVGFLLAMYLLLTQKDYIFALTVVWAYAAIMVAHMDVDMVRYPAKFGGLVLLASGAVIFIADRLKNAQYGSSN